MVKGALGGSGLRSSLIYHNNSLARQVKGSWMLGQSTRRVSFLKTMTKSTALAEDPHAGPWLTSHVGASQTLVDQGGQECETRRVPQERKKN